MHSSIKHTLPASALRVATKLKFLFQLYRELFFFLPLKNVKDLKIFIRFPKASCNPYRANSIAPWSEHKLSQFRIFVFTDLYQVLEMNFLPSSINVLASGLQSWSVIAWPYLHFVSVML